MTTRFADRARVLAGASARLLGWPPETFWAASPSDLMIALGGGDETGAAMDRAALDALQTAHPDEGK